MDLDDLMARARDVLYAAVVSDVLDDHGARQQAMAPSIRPLDQSKILIGRARTGLYAQVYEIKAGENPYELEIRLVDDLKPGEVAVLACNGSAAIAPWGELLSTAAAARGAAGCVTDGLVRDVKPIRAMGFPVFAGGIGPLDSKGRGKIIDIDVPVVCGGVAVATGDVVIGDADGVVVIPQALAADVLAQAFEKVSGEDKTRAALAAGRPLAQVFAEFGIL